MVIHSKKLNNHGSTLIMVLIIVSFISILATVCITTAMLNFKMKTVDRDAKKTFYTDEQAIDEIYSGLGILSMESLSKAYNEEMASIITQSDTGVGMSQSTKVTNVSANKDLRIKFTNNMLNSLITQQNIWTSHDNMDLDTNDNKKELIKKLNSFLENKNETTKKIAKVESVGQFQIKKDTNGSNKTAVYSILFSSCKVQYQNEAGYLSTVTFDGVVQLPDRMVDFTEDANDILTSFKNYQLIGNASIKLDDNANVNVNGNMYAGGDGINLNLNSILSAHNSTVVSKGNISVSKNFATLNVSGSSDVWCTNIITSDDKAKVNIGVNQNSSEVCKTFVQDDLQIDGNNSEVNIGGEYYGYSNEGNTVTSLGPSNSSAIIVNGQNAKVDLSKLSTLVIAGRAYINVGASLADTYMTGESLALKGDQEAYLVPGSLIKNTKTNITSNPVSDKISLNDISVKISKNNFFGYQYLDPSTPYISVHVDNQFYYYLHFASKTAVADYFRIILNDTEFEDQCKTFINDTSIDLQAYRDTRNYMKSLVQNNMKNNLFQSSTKIDESTQIYSSGTLIYNENGIASNDVTDTYSLLGSDEPAAFQLNQIDLMKRYKLITSTLYSPSFYKKMNGVDEKDRSLLTEDSLTHDIFIDGKDINVSEMIGKSVFDNIINSTYLNDQLDFKYQSGNNIMYATKGTVTISDDTMPGVTGGVIICGSNIDGVTLKKDFQGLIIARNQIYIVGNVTVNSGIKGFTSLDDFLNTKPEFKKFFLAWNSGTTSPDGNDSISGITYKDIVKFDNWTNGAK